MNKLFIPASIAPQNLDLSRQTESLLPQSFGRPLVDLARSISDVGLITPPIMAADGRTVVAGSRRLEALKFLGEKSASVIVLPEDYGSGAPEKIYLLAMSTNQERGWNQAETALAFRGLVLALGEDKALGPAAFLNLDKSPKLRKRALAAANLPKGALDLLAQGRLDLDEAARLASWPEKDLKALLEIYEAFAPSSQKRRLWLEWLGDISRRDKLSPAEILEDAQIQGFLDEASRMGRPEAESRARQVLWQRRHPLLAELYGQRRRRLKGLNLPATMKLLVAPDFEDLSFDLNIKFSRPEELAEAARALDGLIKNPNLKTLFEDDQDDAGRA